MKKGIILLVILIFASCRQKNDKKHLGGQTFPQNSKELLSEKEKVSDLERIVTNRYFITFEDAKSFKATDIFGDLNNRISLTDTIENSHESAKQIQNYLQTRFSEYFTTKDSTLILRLANGKNLKFPVWDEKNDEGFNFEHYFKEIDYYLLRVQWSEGNCWLMVNRRNGFKKYISGLPYINKDKFLTINSDLEAGYSFNGIELYSLINDTLREEFSKETTWGPVDIKWINDKQFLVKREHFYFDTITGNQNNKIDYKLGTIKKKTSL